MHARIDLEETLWWPFTIVQSSAKKQSPFVEMQATAGIVRMFAKVTIYARDMNERELKPQTARITLLCGNYGNLSEE